MDAQDHRACLLATENAVVIANYIRLLGISTHGRTPRCRPRLIWANWRWQRGSPRSKMATQWFAPWLGRAIWSGRGVTTEMEIGA